METYGEAVRHRSVAQPCDVPGMQFGKAIIVSTLLASTGEHSRDKRPARRAERALARRMLPGFGPRSETANGHDPLGGTALTMLLVLYPAFASAMVAVAAFLLHGHGGVA